MGLLIYIFFLPKKLQEENDRLLHYLDPTSEIHLIKTVEKQLISEHLSQILTKGRVSVQGVKSLGGPFACLCRRFEFYEVKKSVIIFQKEIGNTFTL